MDSRRASPRRMIVRQLAAFLRGTAIRKVHFAHDTVAPPPLAYVTNFPRLSVPLEGDYSMLVARQANAVRIVPVRGQVVYAGANCWDKPDWAAPVRVLTFLFGRRQVGVSLVDHDGQTSEPRTAIKTTLGPPGDLTLSLLDALTSLATQARTSPLDCLLATSLLHACLRLLRNPVPPPRKAHLTYETLCLHVQENFQNELTRESVARSLGLSPNHVSRVFHREGGTRFNDYVTAVRIERAKFMLKEYGSSLKEIAAHCGFRDVAYFCRVFRRVCKMTPTEYRLKSL